ncbi:SPOR domain-containing protein [Cribrihabitans neustonicus]|uniref:SPOR domain-containing protein n=1 Tax=Cribrihabitans neustonicus TaxID=1429085 RepID=UPI003B5ACE67
MKLARIIALALIAGSAGITGLEAQVLREASPPAEYPPASFEAKQYVDSRGCIYIRAGIGGNVTWVPRVTRSRKQICGYKPTGVAGTTKQPQQAAPAPEIITLPESDQPAQATAAAPAKSSPKAVQQAAKPAAKPAPKPAAKPAPKPVKRAAAAAPAKPPRAAKPAAAAKPVPQKPVRLAPNPAAKPAAPAPAAAAPCPGASALSQQYINRGSARCGPQAAPPVTYGDSPGGGPQSALPLTPSTRVVQKHIYQERRLSNTFSVPKGYRPVWKDGRLNPRRAERTLRQASISGAAVVPPGYVQVNREDGRLNPLRGPRSAAGDAASAGIWTDEVPRRLVKPPLDRPVVILPPEARRSPAEAQVPALRLSSRADPAAPAPDLVAPSQSYIRAATLADAARARAAAEKLAERGLPVRLGALSRQGQKLKVVLAGPFTNPAEARAALTQVQAAGFPGARLSK